MFCRHSSSHTISPYRQSETHMAPPDTETPRHPPDTQTPRHPDTQTPRHTDTHTYTITCQLPCCTEKSFKFCQPHFPQNSPYIPWNLLSTWSQRQSPHPSEPLATISSVSDWVRATMVIIILTFHHIPFIALALNYAVKFALKNTLFSSWRQNMNNRILEVHQVQYIVVM